MKIIKIEGIQLQAVEEGLFPTAEVAKLYGVTPQTIRDHKRLHSDEIFEGLHFIIKKNHLNKPATYWTLEGVYMVGLFIRSERAKKYRKAVARLLKEIKKGNLEVKPTQPALLEHKNYRLKNPHAVVGKLGAVTKELQKLKEENERLKTSKVVELIDKGLKYDELKYKYYELKGRLNVLKDHYLDTLKMTVSTIENLPV